jgi:hypothetical protein
MKVVIYLYTNKYAAVLETKNSKNLIKKYQLKS